MADDLSNPTLSDGATPLPEGRTRLGRYRVVRLLGRGAMGVVYEGEAEDGSAVALKVLPGWVASDADGLKRFLREAQAVSRVSHPNVVGVREAGQDGEVWFLALELVPGGSLHDRMRAKGRLPWREATSIVAQACRGLAAVHGAGIVHRDVKPGNILLAADGTAKLADFGLARMDSAQFTPLTVQGTTLGTPAYMSPEQCRLERPDERSDVYAMGATYYALLTGRPPYQGETAVQVMFAHCSLNPPDPRTMAPDLPAGCAAVIVRAMAREPAERYPSAAALADALQALLASPDQGMGLPPVTLKAVPPVRPTRRRWLATGGAAVASAAGLAWYFSRPTPQPPEAKPPEVKPRSSPFLDRMVAAGEMLTTGRPTALALLYPRWLAAAFIGGPKERGVAVWDLEEGRLHCRLWPDAPLQSIALSPDGQLVAAGGKGGTFIHDLVRNVDWPLPAPGVHRQAFTVEFLAGSRLLAGGVCALVADGKSALRFWDLSTGRVHDHDCVDTVFPLLASNPDRSLLASVGSGKVLRVWRADTRELLQEHPLIATSYQLAWSPDGKTVAVGTGNVVGFYDPMTGRRDPVAVINQVPVWGVTFTPDSRRVLTLGGAVRIWDRASGKQVAQLGDDADRALALTPDGRTLVTAATYAAKPQLRFHSVAPWCEEGR